MYTFYITNFFFSRKSVKLWDLSSPEYNIEELKKKKPVMPRNLIIYFLTVLFCFFVCLRIKTRWANHDWQNTDQQCHQQEWPQVHQFPCFHRQFKHSHCQESWHWSHFFKIWENSRMLRSQRLCICTVHEWAARKSCSGWGECQDHRGSTAW